MGAYENFKRLHDRLIGRSEPATERVVYRDTPPPKVIGKMTSSECSQKFNVISKWKRGMMWTVVVVPQEGNYFADCFEKTKFWNLTDVGEVYIASAETRVNAKGVVSTRMHVFTEHMEPEYDAYGIPVASDYDSFIPETDPFEERRIAERNKRLVKKNLALILDDDI